MSYEIHIAADARAVLEKAPRRNRATMERKLKDLARLASLRSWIDESEARDALRIRVARYEGICSLDANCRRLTLLHLAER